VSEQALSNFAAVDLAAMPSIARGEARAHRVPWIIATPETLAGFGRIVPDFTADSVTIVTWPQPGWRRVVAGTGNEGGIVEERFVMERHPDGGQIFAPQGGAPFVALLAPPGDDVKPENFVAFYCNGSFGIHIDPSVWHQPVFPLQERAVFDNKQGRLHACIAVDFVSEFGCYLEVPLQADV